MWNGCSVFGAVRRMYVFCGYKAFLLIWIGMMADRRAGIRRSFYIQAIKIVSTPTCHTRGMARVISDQSYSSSSV